MERGYARIPIMQNQMRSEMGGASCMGYSVANANSNPTVGFCS